MQLGLLIGLGAGLASALLFYSAARGSPLLSTLLLLLTPLPPCWPGSAGAGCRPPPAPLPGSLVMAVAVERPRSRSAISWRSALPAALASPISPI